MSPATIAKTVPPSSISSPKRPNSLLFHLKTLYLFTSHDIAIIVLPNTICGIILASSKDLLVTSVPLSTAAMRTPLVFLSVWTNLLSADISNQSSPEAIEEDRINKPWRPIPSGRLTPQQATTYARWTRLGLLCVNLFLGGMYPSLFLQLFLFVYNDLRGSETWIPRNLLNGAGYLSFVTGAIEVAAGSQWAGYSQTGIKWFIWIFIMVSCSVQAQDIYDVDGDSLRNRKTMPILFGDTITRYSVLLPVVLGSLWASTYWYFSVVGFLTTASLGAVIGVRLLGNTELSKGYDKRTFTIWGTWLVSMYLLPVWHGVLPA